MSTLRHERFHRRALPKSQASGPGVDNARFERRIQDMLTIVKQHVECWVRGRIRPVEKERWFYAYVTESFGSAMSVLVRGNYAAYCIFIHIFGHNTSPIPGTMDAMSSDGSVQRPRNRTDSERDRSKIDRANYARKKNALNKKYNRWYDEHKSGVACKRRSHRQRDLQAFNARRNERERSRRKAFLSDLLRRLESIRDGNEDILLLCTRR